MLYDWPYKYICITHKLFFQTKFEDFFYALYSSRHKQKLIKYNSPFPPCRSLLRTPSRIYRCFFPFCYHTFANFSSVCQTDAASKDSSRSLESRREIDSLARAAPVFMTKDNARCKIPLCRLSTLCFLCFESLIVPSPHLIQSLSLILLCFARLRTSLDSSRPSYAACDWLTDRTASARSPRTNFEFERTERTRI